MLLCALAFRTAAPASVRSRPRTEGTGFRTIPLALAVGTGLVTWLTTNHGVFTLANVTAWAVATGAWCWAWWPQQSSRAAFDVPGWLRREGWWLGVVGLVLTVSAFFRFHRLSSTPLDPTSDHAEKLLDIHDIIAGSHPIFFIRNGGREPAQFYFTYLLTKLGLPLSFETLKIGTALVGVVATLAVLLLATEVGGRLTGLLAAFLFAVGSWPVTVSRIGLREIYAAVGAAFVLWLLLRYLRSGSRRDALLCGLLLGLSLYGYSSFRIVPPLVLLILAITALYRRFQGRAGAAATVAKDTALMATTAFIAVLPFAHYTAQHREAVLHRTFARVGSAEVHLGGAGPRAERFAHNTWRALQAFNWSGDSSNLGGYWPFLDAVSGAALLAGLLLLLRYAASRSAGAGVLLLSLPVLLLPSTLNLAFPRENPSATRLAVAAPVVYTIAALPLAFVARRLWLAAGGKLAGHAAVAAALAAVLAVSAEQNYVRYFDKFHRLNRMAVVNTHEVVAAIRSLGPEGVALDRVYLLNRPNWLDGRNVGFAFGDFNWYLTHDLPPEAPLPGGTDRPLAFVLGPQDGPRLRQLERSFPDGVYSLVRSDVPGRDFALYVVL